MHFLIGFNIEVAIQGILCEGF